MRVLVTGADGFVGRHLRALLQRRGDEVIAAAGPAGAEGCVALELTDGAAVRSLISSARPDAVIHLAGISSVAASHKNPLLAFDVNARGTVHLLEALRLEAPKSRLLFVSSGEVYGAVGHRAREADAPAPSSPYASSKAAAEVMVLQYARLGLHAVVARAFNHLGAGQQPSFVVPTFASQLAEIAKGGKPPLLQVGNLEAVRDFSHVADVVEAYALLLERAESGATFNVCSGVGRSVRSLLDSLIEISGLKVDVEIDPQRFRPLDAPSLIGDPSRLLELGWKPSRTVETALREVYASFSA